MPTIAEQLAISLPSAGLLVSIYALGVAIGAPVLTALTGRMPRKQLLLALMALFTAGNLLAWQAPGYETLVLAPADGTGARGILFDRIDNCDQHGPERESGFGDCDYVWRSDRCAGDRVPLGAFIGQHFGWRDVPCRVDPWRNRINEQPYPGAE